MLRTQLFQMQEEWVEEECHRVEAQLALKEARQEIQQLKNAVDTVRARLSDADGFSGDVGVQKYFQDINTQNHKLENLLFNMEVAQIGLAKEGGAISGCRTRAGGSAPASVSGECSESKFTMGGRDSYSCNGSPARSLMRSTTYTKLSDQTLGNRNCNDTDFVCCRDNSVPSQADLLLEAAYLSEETASLLNSYTQTFSHTFSHSLPLPHSFPHTMSHSIPQTMPNTSTYEKLCMGEQLAQFHCSLGGVSCMSHPCLSHHHLYLHPLREAGIQTESCPIPATAGYPSDLDTISEQRTFRSQACSPTSTLMSDEGEGDLDSITTNTSLATATVMSMATEPILVSKTPSFPTLPRIATVGFSMDSSLCEPNDVEEEEKLKKEQSKKEGLENTKIRQSEEEQQKDKSSVEGPEVQDELMKVCDLGEISTRAQGEFNFAGCCTEGKQDDQRVKDKQQETQTREGSAKEKTLEITPGYARLSPGVQQPQTSQPPRSSISHEEIAGFTVVEVHNEDNDEGEVTRSAAAKDEDSSGSGKIEKSYWSRHFLVDLLAVAIPVVPTVAWLCRGPVRDGQPMYHFGSLLRGCCTVALHSLRRGGGLRHYPAGGGDLGGSQI